MSDPRYTAATGEIAMPMDKFGKMEAELKKEAAKKGLTGARADAYIYGTLRKMGWTPTPDNK